MRTVGWFSRRGWLPVALLPAMVLVISCLGSRVLLFCSDRDSAQLVESMGARLLVAAKARRLYVLQPSWLARRAASS